MKPIQKSGITAGLMLFTALCHAQAPAAAPSRVQDSSSTAFSLRPAAFHVHDTSRGALAAGRNGFTVSGGRLNGNHEFSVELGYAATASATYNPLPWINYRYYIPLNDTFKLHIGPTLGGTYTTNDSPSDARYSLTYGVGGGLTVAISTNLSLDANYRFLSHTDSGIGESVGGSRIRNQHVLTGGLGYSF